MRSCLCKGPGKCRDCIKDGSDSFSPTVVVLCWFCFVALHVLCLGYYAAVSWCYWHLSGTSLDRWLVAYNLGLGAKDDRSIAICHGCVAAIHLGYLLWMLGWSVKEQQLVFAVYDLFVTPSASATKEDESDHGFVRAVFSKAALVGVDGPYFDVIVLCREIVETALQTQQAYRMSYLLPRTQLNRCYSALLVLNCWSTSLVHTIFHGSSTRRRFCAIICDCIVDLAASVGISVVLIAIYLPDFDLSLGDFPVPKWYEDTWVVHAISEFQVLLVTSWADLTMRMVFALSMLSNMNNMKKILSSANDTKSTNNLRVNHRRTAVLPINPSPTLRNVQTACKPGKLQAAVTLEAQISKVFFFAWGVVILILHLYAESISGIPQCGMQIKPWFSSQPSCSLLILNCYESKIVGDEEEIIAQWNFVDPKSVACVTVRHCPNLVVPSKLTEFLGLKMLKFYNSTIVSWSKSAAISRKHHPNLIMLFLVRVNMTNGELPMGLQGDDFPQTLRDIEFCFTNLRTLPDDFDLKWPQSASMYFEACNFTEVPTSLARLAPFDLSLALNPISHLPASIFEGNVVHLHVGGTLISALPQFVEDVLPLAQLRVDNTNVVFFWAWIDPMVEVAAAVQSDLPTTVTGSNSPYCSDLQNIYEGERTQFSAPQYAGQSRTLSNASVENWPTLRKAVSCGKWPRTWYPIESEDEYSGIKTEPRRR